MIELRRAGERGRSETDWLDSRHTFSFADYRDPRHLGFRALRVINEDRVRPGAGFGTHAHRDMEIVTWVLSGALEHRDSLGTGSVIRPGEIQRMSAGSGITHSEFNASQQEPVHFLQIWIQPNRVGLAPSYEQRAIPPVELADRLRPIAALGGGGGAVRLHQDARILAARLAPGAEVRHALAPGRGAWVQLARGALTLGSEALDAGDGAAASDERELVLQATEPAEVLVLDLA
jgi:redox-sensitive bicupin YhaK (pirin superfamily)